MHWNFWRDAHSAALTSALSIVRPRWTRRFVGAATAVASLCVFVPVVHIYNVPGRTLVAVTIVGALSALLPCLYILEILRYPVDLASALSDELHKLRNRLQAKDIAEASIISLSEHLSEMKLLQNDKIKNTEQYACWMERYQKIVQATYIILSRGVSNNVAMVYISCPIVDMRYIRGCFNDEHMKSMFALEKYIDKLQCIIDGHFLTAQHTKVQQRPEDRKQGYIDPDDMIAMAA